jgi:predicted O-methyltransferase YrrM
MTFVYILLAAQFLLLLYTFHKVRQTHLMAYGIKDLIENQTLELNNIYRQVQAYDALQRKLKFEEHLPPLRGWAASPDFLLTIAEHALNSKPDTIVECSSGASTITLAQCAKLNNRGHVYSLENDAFYAEKTRTFLKKHHLDDWATVLHTPLIEIEGNRKWYDLSNIPEIQEIDMLVIDGPPAFICQDARYPALPNLIDKLKNATVFLDDANRPEEKAIIKLWMNQYGVSTVTSHECEKGCISFTIGPISGLSKTSRSNLATASVEAV